MADLGSAQNTVQLVMLLVSYAELPLKVSHIFSLYAKRWSLTRFSLILDASAIVRSSRPSYVESPADFVDTILGISWVDVDEVQQFYLLYISVLRQARSDLLTAISS